MKAAGGLPKDGSLGVEILKPTAQINTVTQGGWAEKTLHLNNYIGSRIVAVNDKPVTNLDEFEAALKDLPAKQDVFITIETVSFCFDIQFILFLCFLVLYVFSTNLNFC